MRLCLFEPEIPQNVGTLLRLAACMGMAVDIIEPCGFVWSSSKLQRAGMDYLDLVSVTRVPVWSQYHPSGRLVYLTPHASVRYTEFMFEGEDVLMLGRESSGVPPEIAATIPHQITIPMAVGCRSLNVAVSAAMVLGEALRQTALFPKGAS